MHAAFHACFDRAVLLGFLMRLGYTSGPYWSPRGSRMRRSRDHTARKAEADRAGSLRAHHIDLGPMMGIPILVKDTSVEGMPTPAGSVALADSYPADGAPVIQQSPDPLRGLPKPTGFAAMRRDLPMCRRARIVSRNDAGVRGTDRGAQGRTGIRQPAS
jgi:hypothetical protein